jgi:hypothetical protein
VTSIGRLVICATQGHVKVTAQMPRPVWVTDQWAGHEYKYRKWVFDTPERTFCARCKVDL